MGERMTSKTDEDLLRHAVALAREHMLAGDGGPFGAVVAQNDKIIAEGWNEVTSSNDPTAHAEIVAIRRACRQLGRFSLEGMVIYASCEPCPMCLAAIHWARLSRIVFAGTRQQAAGAGFDDDQLYREINMAPEARTVPARHVPLPESDAVFAAWNAKADRIPY